ncbi:MAG: excinuclease ABC subunit UvrC [Deltaproteobacteria bacterium]|nr:excinuclease ABC subunit UvrC [Deltaproteobacteria bacterium]
MNRPSVSVWPKEKVCVGNAFPGSRPAVMMSKLEDKLKNLPDHPGVYMMSGGDGKILYIGKATSLRQRVRSYFSGRPDRAKTALLLTKVRDLEVILTGSEIEALLLENNLIKKHRPPFNVELKDDKNYPYVRLDRNQLFPRFEVVRRRRADGARYFGPFPAVNALRATLSVLNKHFRLRRCRGERFHNRVRPCLNYQMDLCAGPCCAKVTAVEYRRLLSEAALILGGRGRPVLKSLERRMHKAAAVLDFEAAAGFRDALADLKVVLESQAIDAGRDEDLDVLGAAANADGDCILYLLTIRRGNVVGGRPFSFSAYGGRQEELPGAFLQSYYSDGGAGGRPPQVIVVSQMDEGSGVLESWLGQMRGAQVRLLVPSRGRRLQLLRLAQKNAEEHLDRQLRDDNFPETALRELARVCELKGLPEVIEGLDIANLQADCVVASLVCFRGGQADKSAYRRYRLEDAAPDDFARMAEVVRRRFSGEEGSAWPDLLLLDGGRPQLIAVERMLQDLAVSVPLVAVAKGRNRQGRKDRQVPDSFYQSGRKEALPLARRSPAARLLQQVRDEAHRFALGYHRLLRKLERETVLVEIEGVGKARARRLLQRFGSLEKIIPATPQDLVEKAGLPLAVARNVCAFLQGQEQDNGSSNNF